jgi:RHS repeat-associated protein
MTQIPASAASTYTATNTAAGASGTVGLGYFVNDLTQTQVQDRSSKTTLALDAIGRFTSSTLATWDTGANTWAEGVTTTNHYDGGGDRPAWTETTTPDGAATTRYVDGPSGDLTMTTGKDGGRTLLLTDLHGDTIATLPIADGATDANWTKLQYVASDEYGNPTPLATATNPNPPSINNWHATAQKQQTRLGTTLMGARTYLPTLGTFTTMDPVPGGNTTTYTYPQNPNNTQDLNGQFKLRKWLKKNVTWKNAGKILTSASNITAWCPLAQCQAATLALGGLGAAAYWIGGDKKAASNALVGTVTNLLLGGRGKVASSVVGVLARSGRIGQAAGRAVQSRFIAGEKGGVLGMLWSRASKIKDPYGRGAAKSGVAGFFWLWNGNSAGWYK